ncbi:MAG: hypothetical protein LC792_17535 [Actinobacteria bacterium]|nr:hypothetical protein [Actinomycetota bacterium]
MLRDRLMGVVCLGAAVVAATWGGNGVLQRASALGAGAARPPAHTDALGLSAAAPDTAPPAADAATTATSATPSTTATTAKAPGAATTSTLPGEAPAALARRATLTQADVPAGFTVTTPAPSDGSIPVGDSPFEHCAGAEAPRLTRAIGARTRSATFARPDTGSVSSSAVVFDQPATAGKALDLMATPGARSCFEDLINARLARNPRLSQDAKGSLGPAPSPAVGDGGVAYRFDVRLPAEDVDPGARPDDPPVRYVADLVFVRKGRTVVLAEFDNLRQPWADQALRGVIAALVAHV